MELSVERDGGVIYCSVDGRVDGDSATHLRDGVLEQVGDGDRALILDLSRVTYLSSAGLQSVLLIARFMGKRGLDLGLCGLTEGVRQVFEIAGFDRALSVFSDRSAAVAALANPPA